MSRIGMFCFLGRGHLDPALAFGRHLASIGHDVTIFHLTIARAAVQAAGLRFCAVDDQDATGLSLALPIPRSSGRRTVDVLTTHADRVLRSAPPALLRLRIEALIIDQLDVAACSIAEALCIPYVVLSCTPPICFDDERPPVHFGWQFCPTEEARRRNRRAHDIIAHIASPIIVPLNSYRARNNLLPYQTIAAVFRSAPIITQLPLALEFPGAKAPKNVFYAGPLRDEFGPPVYFPWDRLNGKPLVYVSLGTVHNERPKDIAAIARVCFGFDVQIAISLGGGRLLPDNFRDLPGDPIVVHYAPQRKLLQHCVCTINCGGLNTVLDSLSAGVPVIALPIAEDQPGVAARLAASGAGMSVPINQMASSLPDALRICIESDALSRNARQFSEMLSRVNGIQLAMSAADQFLKL